MPARIDIENLTEDELFDVAKTALMNLTDQRQIEVIMTTLDENTLCELAAHIEDI